MNWEPFETCARHAPPPRAVHSPEGIADRLRAAAFAEFQALRAFEWAARVFQDAPEELRAGWLHLAEEEKKHMRWLLERLKELGFSVEERRVSTRLWDSLSRCPDARSFARFMASAEDRGRIAGERFFEAMKKVDPTSAEIFRKIAEEEVKHIQLAERFFPH